MLRKEAASPEILTMIQNIQKVTVPPVQIFLLCL